MLATAYHRLVVRIVLAILVGSAVAAAPSAASSVVISFRTPTGNIGCVYTSGLGPGPALRCDIRTGLRPKPPRPRNCDLDWGDSYELGARGRAGVTCHGDTAIDQRARVLRYGSTWRRGPFTCRSKRTGLRCRNLRGHGFFMSRQHSYRF
jgi:hypothetical protein